MAHANVTVSLVVDVAVMTDTLLPDTVLVVWVTPPEKVAVNDDG
jgi:hypothetical protein